MIEHTAKAVQAAWAGCFSALEALGYRPDMSRPVMERYGRRLVARHLCELCVPIL